MGKYKPKFQRAQPLQHSAAMGYQGGYQLARPLPEQLRGNFKYILIILAVTGVTNLVSHLMFNPAMGSQSQTADYEQLDAVPGELYLMDKAAVHVSDVPTFERKVREIAGQLRVPPEWLMAVMYSESKFDASVRNFKGSGATGLIQFMPAAASEMNVSLERLRRMDHVQQLEYVYLYLQTVRDRYGEFQSLTDLYLGILYPKALGQDYCYTLYAKPSQAFEQNAGLDENKDGRVTVSDIDRRMQRLYPTAYIAGK